VEDQVTTSNDNGARGGWQGAMERHALRSTWAAERELVPSTRAHVCMAELVRAACPRCGPGDCGACKRAPAALRTGAGLWGHKRRGKPQVFVVHVDAAALEDVRPWLDARCAELGLVWSASVASWVAPGSAVLVEITRQGKGNGPR
jgi:hypothetical protein